MSQQDRLDALLQAHDRVCREIQLEQQMTHGTDSETNITGIKEARNAIETLILEEATRYEGE